MLNSSVETIGCLSCLHLSSSLDSKKGPGLSDIVEASQIIQQK